MVYLPIYEVSKNAAEALLFQEYHKKTLTRFLGSPYRACYLMAVSIFAFGILRDSLYERALRDQPQTLPDSTALKVVAALLFVIGQVLVLSSTWALGVTGTYLGDYCGILQDSMGASVSKPEKLQTLD